MFKIKQERDRCTGCGSCATICGENWEMKDDGKSSPKKTKLKEIGCNQQAADACPVKCIHVTEE